MRYIVRLSEQALRLADGTTDRQATAVEQRGALMTTMRQGEN